MLNHESRASQPPRRPATLGNHCGCDHSRPQPPVPSHATTASSNTECPRACANFLKLCKAKYYHGCLFFNVQENFMAQAGDPTATGAGGDSVFGQLYGALTIVAAG
ncbi:Peptidyl-prolyl cis-trans isomerase-like protein [Phytophthora cinnamomi]|uniref:Peptidyl-prolyl cis-trans isomerase-like protein n=1 Tax=Phytophthora cinnamomi TaxID=4785 RepID=UPI0035595152|nr:Peptidyl-prolyl cis-trans isomerase-like protein [Phytophthora cinnamomi]